jgi:hypothetical protein
MLFIGYEAHFPGHLRTAPELQQRLLDLVKADEHQAHRTHIVEVFALAVLINFNQLYKLSSLLGGLMNQEQRLSVYSANITHLQKDVIFIAVRTQHNLLIRSAAVHDLLLILTNCQFLRLLIPTVFYWHAHQFNPAALR